MELKLKFGESQVRLDTIWRNQDECDYCLTYHDGKQDTLTGAELVKLLTKTTKYHKTTNRNNVLKELLIPEAAKEYASIFKEGEAERFAIVGGDNGEVELTIDCNGGVFDMEDATQNILYHDIIVNGVREVKANQHSITTAIRDAIDKMEQAEDPEGFSLSRYAYDNRGQVNDLYTVLSFEEEKEPEEIAEDLKSYLLTDANIQWIRENNGVDNIDKALDILEDNDTPTDDNKQRP